MPLASGDGRRPARMLTWIDGRIRRGMPRLASAVRIATKFYVHAVTDMDLRRRWSTTVVCQAKVSRPGAL